jgi:hypothetical protein
MLPTSLSNNLREFLQSLEELQSQSEGWQPQAFAKAQEIFASKIINCGTEGLDPASATKVRSYLTEIHKQMRLLQIDLAFLRSARADATTQARQTRARDRLNTLMAYSQTLLRSLEV